MTMNAEVQQSLMQRAAKWRSALADKATGPLVIAGEVVGFVADWDAYKEESGGRSATQWLEENTGFDLPWFKRRARAVEVLGKAACRALHHDVAVYLCGIPDGKRDAAVMAVIRECKKRHDIPLTKGQALPIIREIVGHNPKRKSCAICDKLRKQIEAAGLTPEA